ncbi:hypothetical protein PsAD5_03969 [Pseudovibrio sp. Ad5]|nr:hypothetical protein PsAD5_03969 [Pseudovibrio sp. Ad5]
MLQLISCASGAYFEAAIESCKHSGDDGTGLSATTSPLRRLTSPPTSSRPPSRDLGRHMLRLVWRLHKVASNLMCHYKAKIPRGLTSPLWVPHRAALVRNDGMRELPSPITSPPHHDVASYLRSNATSPPTSSRPPSRDLGRHVLRLVWKQHKAASNLAGHFKEKVPRDLASPLWVPHRAALVRDDGMGELPSLRLPHQRLPDPRAGI